MTKEYSIGNGRNVSVIYNEQGVAQVSKELIEQCFIPLFRQSEKYKWHDLQKNPDDLPKTDEMILCAWQGGTRLWYDTFFYYITPRKYFSKNGESVSIIGTEKFSAEGQVVAWKYIEPFEEVEG